MKSESTMVKVQSGFPSADFLTVPSVLRSTVHVVAVP